MNPAEVDISMVGAALVHPIEGPKNETLSPPKWPAGKCRPNLNV